MLGYRYNTEWRDMSDYLVHFTKDGPPHGTAYQNMLSILYQGMLKPGPTPFGCARTDYHAQGTQFCTCFSEIPLDRLARLAKRRGTKFGIGFRKKFVTERGGAPVWYVNYGSPLHAAIEALKGEANKSATPAAHPLWRLTPLIDFPGTPPAAPYNYDFAWEREWRVPGALVFTPDDVPILFIPAEQHKDARAFFETAARDNTGPAYLCPYLDPDWNDQRIEEALGAQRSPNI